MNRVKDLTCCSRTQGDVLRRLNFLLLRRSWPLVVLLPSFIGNEQSDGTRLKSTRIHNYCLERYDITTETSDITHYHVLSSERAVLRTLQKKQAKERLFHLRSSKKDSQMHKFTCNTLTLHIYFIHKEYSSLLIFIKSIWLLFYCFIIMFI